MVGTGIEISINVNFLTMDLVGERAIKKMRDTNIQKGDRVVFLGFHRELDMGREAIKMIKERDHVGMAMRPYDKSVIYKTKPTFGFEREVA
jgi:hypothetical protein